MMNACLHSGCLPSVDTVYYILQFIVVGIIFYTNIIVRIILYCDDNGNHAIFPTTDRSYVVTIICTVTTVQFPDLYEITKTARSSHQQQQCSMTSNGTAMFTIEVQVTS